MHRYTSRHAAASPHTSAGTNMRSATISDLLVPRTRLRLGVRASSSAAPRLWNALSTNNSLYWNQVDNRNLLQWHIKQAAIAG